jgi:hypothetical protein
VTAVNYTEDSLIPKDWDVLSHMPVRIKMRLSAHLPTSYNNAACVFGSTSSSSG